MQYVSALALASLSGKPASKSKIIKQKIPSPPFLKPLENQSMMPKSMLSLPAWKAELLKMYTSKTFRLSQKDCQKFQSEPLHLPQLQLQPRNNKRNNNPKRKSLKKPLNLLQLLKKKILESISSVDLKIRLCN